MPTGPGSSIDGIWKYGEDDSNSLASDLLNRLGDSVRTTINGLGSTVSAIGLVQSTLEDATGIKHFSVSTTAARDAITGASTNDRCEVQADNVIYRYNGANWRVWEQAVTTFTPTVNNVTLGTGGSVVGWYSVSAGICTVDVLITLGTGGTITGDVNFTLPVTRSTAQHPAGNIAGIARLRDASPGTTYAGVCEHVTNNIAIRSGGATYTTLTATSPFTWTNGDFISASATYWVTP